MKMNRLFRSLSLFCLILSLLAGSMPMALAADSTISYQGSAKGFVLEPKKDLFTGLKDVMPGDTLTQTITIRNDIRQDAKIRVYLRALPADPQMKEFLSQLTLSVSQEGQSPMFLAPADQTAGLTEWKDLGLVYSGGKIKLNVELQVPLELDNRFQNMEGILRWEFKVEEFPVEHTDPQPPKTGDTIFFWVIVMAASALVLMLLTSLGKKRR